METNQISVNKEREKHFEAEKKFLADSFGDYLLERLKSLDVNKVILLIDAGTTLELFLRKLGEEAKTIKQKRKGGGADWIDNIVVVTNNFSVFNYLLENCIYPEEKKDLGSETALRCVLLPGRILPAYDAIVGFEQRYLGQTLGTVLSHLKPYKVIQRIKKSVKKYHKKEGEEVKIISLITGNWIRIRETFARFPVPLARGAGHLNIKREMIEVADEVYVISPLGKIFVGHEKHKVNSLLRSIADDKNTAYKHSYKELNTNKMHLFKNNNDGDANSEKIKLITTSRAKTSILYESSERIFEYLNASNEGSEADSPNILKIDKKINYEDEKAKFSLQEIEKVSHLMFAFDESEQVKNKTQKELEESLKIDFPHPPTRNRKFLEAFYVNEDRLNKLFSKK